MKAEGGVRKLVIKPLRLQPRLPADFEATNWDRLCQAVRAVQRAAPVACSLEALYTAVQDLCLHKLAPKLYAQLQQECDGHAAAQLSALAGRSGLGAVTFLEHFSRTWESYCSQMLLIRQIFLYLDRTYVLTTTNTRSLFDMGLQLFRKHLGGHPELERKVISGLQQLIDADRNGESVDYQMVQGLLRMLSSLDMYQEMFQPIFLERSMRYYTAEGERLVQELEVPAYLVHCERRLGQEFSRCDSYLEPATRKPLIEAVEGCLLERHIGFILERGLDSLLAEHRIEDLARLYSLCARVNALAALCAAFKAHVRRVGAALVLDEEKDADMVPLLLEMRSKVHRLVQEAFAGNVSFANAAKEGFESFINQRANKPAELVAKHMDAALRGGGRAAGGASGEELESTIDSAMALFRLIQGKDVFEAFYKKDLAKRLLLGRSVSIDAEKGAISKLKAECGSQFTSKLEGMFKDIELSRDVMAAFRQSGSASTLADLAPGMDLSVQILTSGFWPSYPIMDCTLPQQLSAAQGVFKDFYLSKHSGRKLVWCSPLGTCILKAGFDAGSKELSVSLFQAAVLMLFNDAPAMTFPDIKAATGLEDKELRRTLQSLACGRERVLLKEPRSKEVGDSDSFRINDGYTSRLYRVKINSIQLKETADENQRTNDSVLQDRQYQIDAAIVRIMKMRRTLSHKLLVNELVAQLRFPIQPADLKKRIESLIDREYMERDARDSQVYSYVA